MNLQTVSEAARRALRGPAQWAMSHPSFNEWMKDLGIRQTGHSTLLWFREGAGCHTRVTTRNYFSLNYGIPTPQYSFALHDADGNRLAQWQQTARPDETLIIDSHELARRFRLASLEGTLTAEVLHKKLDPPRFLRVNVDYYNDEGLITTVHDQGRLVRLPRKDVQSLVYVREDDECETAIVLQNWYRYRRRPDEYFARAQLELLNSRGDKCFADVAPIPACGARQVSLQSLFPHAATFLGGRPGGLRVHSNISMGRSIPLVRSRKTGMYAVSHTTGDHDPTIYQRELLNADQMPEEAWAPIWSSFVEESDTFHTDFSFFNNWLPVNSYSIDVRVFDSQGTLRMSVPSAFTLAPEATHVLSMADFLGSGNIRGPFSGMVEARIAPRHDQPEMPGPGMLQVNTIWSTPHGLTQSNNQSLGFANSPRATPHFLSPRRTKMFGRIIATERYETMLSLMNPSSEENYAQHSDTQIIVHDASGTRQQMARIQVGPHGSVWLRLEELFPNLREFLSESNGVSTALVLDGTLKLTGYLGVRDRSHGTVGIDHLFGG